MGDMRLAAPEGEMRFCDYVVDPFSVPPGMPSPSAASEAWSYPLPSPSHVVAHERFEGLYSPSAKHENKKTQQRKMDMKSK